uniref:Uncharacterized protein n=1 Tax=Ananas comosus var. bracteatus TaxID=296719 RepID=A0A6V7PGB8_ANACO|nr:unnamed protein product [Ananas comosus var. bracteatus]
MRTIIYIFAQRDRSLPSRDRSLAANPKNQRSGTGLSLRGTGLLLRKRVRGPVSPARDRLPQTASTLLTGGPVSPSRDRSPRVKTLRTCPEFQFSNFLGRKTFYNPPPSVEKLEIHPNTRTPQFAKVQCVTFTPPKKSFVRETQKDKIPQTSI